MQKSILLIFWTSIICEFVLTLILHQKQLWLNMKLVWDSKFIMDADDITACELLEVILFSSILKKFYNFIGIECNSYCFGIPHRHILLNWSSALKDHPQALTPARVFLSVLAVLGLARHYKCTVIWEIMTDQTEIHILAPESSVGRAPDEGFRGPGFESGLVCHFFSKSVPPVNYDSAWGPCKSTEIMTCSTIKLNFLKIAV